MLAVGIDKIPAFLLGVLIAKLSDNKINLNIIHIIIYMLVALIMYFIFRVSQLIILYEYLLILFRFFCISLILIINQKIRLSNSFLFGKVLRLFGNISIYIYVIHLLIWDVSSYFIDNTNIKILISILLTLIFSFVFKRICNSISRYGDNNEKYISDVSNNN